MPLTHIDPVIREIIEDLKKKNPPLGEQYENEKLGNALLFIRQDGEGIARRISIIDGWYAVYQQDALWNKIKNIFPKDAGKILDSRNNIDEIYCVFKAKRAQWEDVEKAIDQYAEAWRKVSKKLPA